MADENTQATAAAAVAANQTFSAPAVVIPVPTAEELADMSKEDVQKLEADLEAATAAALASAKRVLVAKVNELKAEEITWAQSFRTKHGVSLQVAVLGAALLLGILGRVLGL